jgi:hypothetical protein
MEVPLLPRKSDPRLFADQEHALSRGTGGRLDIESPVPSFVVLASLGGLVEGCSGKLFQLGIPKMEGCVEGLGQQVDPGVPGRIDAPHMLNYQEQHHQRSLVHHP